jgi:dienelactone hydrolase
VTTLKPVKEIDGKRIFVAGHSLGAIVAPKIGALDSSIAGLILLAGSPRPLEDIILEQVTYLYSLKGEATRETKEALDKLSEQVARVKNPKLTADVPKADLPLGIPAAYWLGLRAYDPAAIAAGLKMPMLVLQGERDYQVTMTDFAAWRKVLDGKAAVRFKSYPTLNHLFMAGEGKSKPTEYDKADHVAPEVIDDVAAWVKAR